MIALYILGALVLIVFIILLMPLAVHCSFGEQVVLSVKVGPVKRVLLPKPDAPKKEKVKKPKKEKPAPAEGEEPKKKRSLPKPTFDEVKDLLAVLWRGIKKMVKRTGRRIVLDPVECYATIGHADPAMTAEIFGYVNAAMWTVLPFLQETVRMPHPEVHVRMDFDATKITARGAVGLKFTLGGILLMGLGLAGPLLGWAFPFIRAARKRAKAAEKAAKAAMPPVSAEAANQ